MNLWLWLPSPQQFQGRFLATGGGGLAITMGQNNLQPGIVYGAATVTTDGGFGSWRTDLSAVLLRANGTLNYEMLYSYAYTGVHEMSVLGKEFTRRFYKTERVYSYWQGCSEGGREGFSQVQRFGNLFDGAAIGAPALRQAFLQIMHLFPLVVETTRKYYPSPCELEQINNDTVAACDGLDGRVDGVVSRTDLCRLRYKASASVGKSYSCPASKGKGFPGAAQPPAPAIQGTVSAEAVAVAEDIWRGLFDSHGRQIFPFIQPSAAFDDAATGYNNATGKYEALAAGFGVQFVNLFLNEIDSNYVSLSNITYDTLRGWILEGMQKFSNTLQTTWPDLTEFHEHGGKILHFHGEADPGIPAASSVIYHDAVRRTMYPSHGFNESYSSLNDWYRLFLVPGAGHCGPSVQQPGPYPHDALASLIAWVEQGVNPTRLNATVISGPKRGAEEKLCSFPLRPLWKDGVFECVYDQASIDSWTPKLDSIPVPVY